MNPQFAEIGQQFIAQYYQLFDSNRSQLASMYNEASVFTFEGTQFMGQASIMQHLCEVRARHHNTSTRSLASTPCVPGRAMSSHLISDPLCCMSRAFLTHLVRASGGSPGCRVV